MGRVTRASDRHIIWSNRSLDVDDWREDYKEFLEDNELDDAPNDEQALYEWMVETNDDYLSDERVNLNVQLSQPIIVIGDIGILPRLAQLLFWRKLIVSPEQPVHVCAGQVNVAHGNAHRYLTAPLLQLRANRFRRSPHAPIERLIPQTKEIHP